METYTNSFLLSFPVILIPLHISYNLEIIESAISYFDKFKQAEIDKVNQNYLNENLIADKNTNYIVDNQKILDNNCER